ncbi:hypothetical protein [Roseibium sp.]|uniref:hypothetical protein n=1 Tax=Roseibium sp. TaxID=1936156 RepID=UPI0039EDF58A
MPDQNGLLSKSDKDKVIAWLDQKGRNHNCPVCSNNNWSIGDHLLSGTAFAGGNIVVGAPAYPMAFIVCSNCAYTRHFMAIPLGILPSEPTEEK